MIDPAHTTEVDASFHFVIVDLIDVMHTSWEEVHTELYPGDPYDHNEFRKHYSDHHPVLFQVTIPTSDDD